jgi:hypothetical protein
VTNVLSRRAITTTARTIHSPNRIGPSRNHKRSEEERRSESDRRRSFIALAEAFEKAAVQFFRDGECAEDLDERRMFFVESHRLIERVGMRLLHLRRHFRHISGVASCGCSTTNVLRYQTNGTSR